MSANTQEPQFEPLRCQSRAQCTYEKPFSPVAHDLIIMGQDGRSKIARNASVGQMINVLSRSSSCSDAGGSNDSKIGSLIIIRFEEDDIGQDAPLQAVHDWSSLWPIFDGCCSDESSPNFVSSLRQSEPRCYSYVSRTSALNDTGTIIHCNKTSYGLNFLHKHVLLAHHIHRVNGKVTVMTRIVTCGIPEGSIEAILAEALLIAKPPSSVSVSAWARTGSAAEELELATRIPHPKSFLCGMLVYIEEFCRKNLAVYQKWMQNIVDDINLQRDPSLRKPKALEIQSFRLSEVIFGAAEVRQKVQFLLSAVTSLQDMDGLPNPSDSGTDQKLAPDTYDGDTSCQWSHQLQTVRTKLFDLRRRCQQDVMDVENLQERVKPILSIISILQVEKENSRAAEARIRDEEVSVYQTEMLARQEFIAVRTKRDNTVMKVIAVLTALFLPGTFIATVFSVPVFNWDQENPIGPHFRTYWFFTAPITTTLVLGFSIWFLKMWYEDSRAEKLRAHSELRDDIERVGVLQRGKNSMES